MYYRLGEGTAITEFNNCCKVVCYPSIAFGLFHPRAFPSRFRTHHVAVRLPKSYRPTNASQRNRSWIHFWLGLYHLLRRTNEILRIICAAGS